MISRSDTSPQVLIGKRLRSERLRKGWNQSELALKSHVARTTIYQLERGAIGTPHAATLHRLAMALEIPVTWLNLAGSGPADDQREQPPQEASRAAEFDRQTNPFVDVVQQQSPEIFLHFTQDDWQELHSSFGTGGALTEEGVLRTALTISQKRETLRRVSLLLETHLAGPTTAVVNSLFELISVTTAQTGNLPGIPSCDE